MTTKELKENILQASLEIIRIAREKCTNNFSDNIEFVIRRFDANGLNLFDLHRLRKEVYEKSTKLSVDNVVQELYDSLSELSWIDLIIYKAEKRRTIIEVQLVKRQPNDSVNDKESGPLFHAAIPIPQYAADSSVKFDINWQQNTFNHRLRLFLWNRKTKKEIKRLNTPLKPKTPATHPMAAIRTI